MKLVHVQRYLAVLLLALIVGCTALGLPTAQTFNEKVAVAIGTVTTIRTSAVTLLQAKKITPDDAQNVQDQANAARKGIVIAQQATDPITAGNKLAQATAALTALQSYLATKGN